MSTPSTPGNGSKPTKIAYLGSTIPVLSATFIYREVLELQRRGIDIALYSLHKPDGALLSAESVPLVSKTFYLQPVAPGNLIGSHLAMAFRNPFRYLSSLCKMVFGSKLNAKNRFRSLMHWGEGVVLAKQMLRDDITHIHSHYASQPTSVARVIHLLTHIPYSFSAHAHDIWQDPLLLTEKLRETKFVACCSQCGVRELSKEAEGNDASKIHLVYHGIDVRRFTQGDHSKRNPKLILALGRLEPVKGYPYLLEACAQLKKDKVDFTCRIIGEGPDRPRLEGMMKELDITDRVVLFGALPQEALLKHYHEAAIFVLPCIEPGDGQRDGLPNAILEALASGLPVVTTTTGGITEAVESGVNGFICTPKSGSEIHAHLAKLLKDEELRIRIGNKARETTVARFDNRTSIEPLLHLFRKHCGMNLP